MKLLKKKSVIFSLIGVGLLAVFVYASTGRTPIPEFTSQQVVRQSLYQTVSETGSVQADLSLAYGWEISGKVTEVLHEVGDMVTTSMVIARLDSAKQQAALSEARAALAAAQARLNLDLAGPSDEATAKARAAVDQATAALLQAQSNLAKVEAQGTTSRATAEAALQDAKNNLQLISGGSESQVVTNAYTNLANTLKAAATSLSDALTAADNILGIDNTFANDDFEDVLGTLDTSALNAAHGSYVQAKATTVDAENSVIALTAHSSQDAIAAASQVVGQALTRMQIHLLDVQRVLTATRPIGDLSQSELDTLKTSITTAQKNVNTAAANVASGNQAVQAAFTSLTTYQIAYTKAMDNVAQIEKQVAADTAVAQAQVAAQQANLAQVQATYDDLLAPPRSVDVASLRADVARQLATVDALEVEYAKTELHALADGVLTTLDIEVGENVTANQEVVGIISEALTVRVDISESDIAKVSLGDPVTITLDAYGDDTVFTGSVLSIDPAETELSGVVYYQTTIVFDDMEGSYDIRSGMTANIDIRTDMRADALVIPRRAVLHQDDKKIVRVVTDASKGMFEERIVTTGLVGDDGLVEVLSGLQEGDEIVTFLREAE